MSLQTKWYIPPQFFSLAERTGESKLFNEICFKKLIYLRFYIFKTFGRASLRPRESQIKLSTYTRMHDTCRNVLYVMQRKGSRKCVVRLNKDAVLPAWPAIHMLKRHSDRCAQTMTNPGVSADPIGDRDRDWFADRMTPIFSAYADRHTCSEQWTAFIRS